MSSHSPNQVGFFGKLPSHGDFIGRRLDPAFRTALDDWLQQSIAISWHQLGTAWLPAYLIAPIWRFMLAPGVCGAATWGVMMPSVDRVGRYFPLVVAAQPTNRPSTGMPLDTARDWFDRAEDLILRALDDDVDADMFDRDLAAMGMPGDADPPSAQASLLAQAMESHPAPSSLWWTLGSDTVSASALLSPGLPAPIGFAAFLDGRWDRWGWHPGQGETTCEGLPVLMQAAAAAGRQAAGSTA